MNQLTPDQKLQIEQSIIGQKFTEASTQASGQNVILVNDQQCITMQYQPNRLMVSVNQDGIVTGCIQWG